MSEQEKKRQGIYDLINTKTKPPQNSEIIEISLWLSLSPDLNSLDYIIRGILENKTNTTPHVNVG